jgi:hypothetical protein
MQSLQGVGAQMRGRKGCGGDGWVSVGLLEKRSVVWILYYQTSSNLFGIEYEGRG